MRSGDTAFLLICAALVMFMIPGLAMFYGGMVRAKNVLGTLMQSMFALGIVSLLWVVAGYTLAFGPDHQGLIGGFGYLGFAGVGQSPNDALAPGVPHIAFAAFQMMFAAITPALITGAFAERIKFPAFVMFTAAWLILVYSPIAHWVWAPGGWIRELGALDFAGGTVVHINSGAAAIAAAMVIGKRRDFGTVRIAPHNLTLTILGAGVLWFGWFGFNAGSALSAGSLASSAFVATNLGAAGGVCGWAVTEALKHRRCTSLGAASGGIAGLVAITPAAGFVDPLAAIAIGLCGGAVCALAIGVKFSLHLDDSLDVAGVHMTGGVVGAVLTGVFATTAVNSAGTMGLIGGEPSLILKQLVAVAVVAAFSFFASFGIFKAIDALVGLRIAEDDEVAGLDWSQHSEIGYAFGDASGRDSGTQTETVAGSLGQPA
ncbi:MAG TPA: ammonium transporter [Actinomycetota bacterium]|jgi:Amt family ammonium transporter|nr:ammonium transporter [Actinomycetota bacterium]